MEYFVIVMHQNKFLFRTDNKSITSTDELVRIYKIFLSRFPETEGYRVCPRAIKQEYVSFDEDQFKEAVQKGRGKGFLLRVKNAHRKSANMAHAMFKQIIDGIF